VTISHQPYPCPPLCRDIPPASRPPFLNSQVHRVSSSHLAPTYHLTFHAPSRHRRHIDSPSIFQSTQQTLSMRTFLTYPAINHSALLHYNTQQRNRPRLLRIRVRNLLPTPRMAGMVYRPLHKPRSPRNTSPAIPWIPPRRLLPKNFRLDLLPNLIPCISRPPSGSRGGAGSGACLAMGTKVTYLLWTNSMSLRVRAARHPSNGRSPRARTVVRYQKSSRLSPQHLRRTPRR